MDNMKKILLITAIALTGCAMEEPKKSTETAKEVNKTTLRQEKLMGTVPYGLSKIEINDSTTILLYRGSKSCTMIQLK